MKRDNNQGGCEKVNWKTRQWTAILPLPTVPLWYVCCGCMKPHAKQYLSLPFRSNTGIWFINK